jgi:hypothetical protein
VKVGSRAQRIVKWIEPSTRVRRQLAPRSIVLTVRPDEILARSCHAPFVERLAPNERSQHLALDQSDSATAGYAGQISINRFDANYVRSVATRLYTEERTSELTAKEWNACSG